MRATWWKRCLPLLLVPAGCYRYEPIETPRLGAEVRARLKVEAAVRRSTELDQPVRHVDGSVVAFTGDAVSLDVLVAQSYSAFQNVTIRDTVTFALSELEQFQERRFAPARTALFVTALVGGGALVIHGIATTVGGNEGEDGGGNGTEAAVVPLFTVFGSGGGLRLAWPPW